MCCPDVSRKKAVWGRPLHKCLQGMILIIPLIYSMSLCAQDDYLQALEDEAESLSGENSAAPPPKLETGIPTGLGRADFESILKRRYFGSYLFYSKLSDDRKQEVYDLYLSSNEVGPIRKKIMVLFSSRSR